MEDIHALQQPAAAHTLTQTNLLATVVCFLLQAWPVAASSPPCSAAASSSTHGDDGEYQHGIAGWSGPPDGEARTGRLSDLVTRL